MKNRKTFEGPATAPAHSSRHYTRDMNVPMCSLGNMLYYCMIIMLLTFISFVAITETANFLIAGERGAEMMTVQEEAGVEML